MCNYDLDDVDLRWLAATNGERALMGGTTISELEMERSIEDFEKQCWEKINITLRNNEAQEDQDDSVICDVCRSVCQSLNGIHDDNVVIVFISFFSLTVKSATRWCSVTSATSACIRRVMESQRFQRVLGCVAPALSESRPSVSSVRTREAR